MTVEVILMQGGHPAGPLGAYFADDFIRADQPFYIGQNWSVCFQTPNNVDTASTAAAEINVAGSTLAISQGGGGSTRPSAMAYPARFNGEYCWTQSQFAEIKIVSWNTLTNGTLPGPMVLSKMNDASAYYLELDNTGVNITYAVQRWVNGVPTVIIGGRPTAAGEILRLEAVVGSSSTVINAYRNGVLDATATDNSGSRLTTGIPGIYLLGLILNGTAAYTLFKCGSLPQISTLANYP